MGVPYAVTRQRIKHIAIHRAEARKIAQSATTSALRTDANGVVIVDSDIEDDSGETKNSRTEDAARGTNAKETQEGRDGDGPQSPEEEESPCMYAGS